MDEVLIPLGRFVGELWGDVSDEHKRDIAGVLCLLAGLAVIGAAPDPNLPAFHALHRLVWWSTGHGWPVLAIGLVAGGIALIHPPKTPVRRFQVLAAAVAAWSLLGLLSMLPWTTGGKIGQIGPLAARGIGPWLAALLLVLIAVLAGITAARLRIADAIDHGARALGLPRRGQGASAANARVGANRRTRPQPAAASSADPAEEIGSERAAAALPDGELDAQPEDESLAAEEEEDDEAGEADQTAADETLGTDVIRLPARPRHRRSAWQLPSLSLLAAPRPRSRRQEQEVRERVAAIEEKLRVLGIQGAEVIDVDHGPTVTRYVLAIPGDVAVSRVEKMQKDLSLALAASPLRIEAPIPGRSAIGIEVPAARREVVSLRGVLEAEGLAPEQRALAVGLGRDVAGKAVIGDLATMPHLLVAGATGQGKSVGINCLICSLLLLHSPDTLRLLLIDPKRVELAGYAGLPHLAAPVIVELQQAAQALAWAGEEMDRRYRTLASAGVRNIAAYNERAAADRRLDTMPYLVIVIDELANLMMVAKDEVQDLITNLAQMARAVGIHLVLATQRPSVDVITGLIKANIPSRIAFTVASGPDSRTILDSVGAEKLIGRGDMLYQPVDGGQIRLQGAFMEDREVDAVVDHWRRQGSRAYLGGLPGADPDDVGAARLGRQGGEAED